MTIRKTIEFGPSMASDGPRTKFGGQPNWIEGPQWPISKQLESPMRFIGQVNLGDVSGEFEGKTAFLFMTEEDEYVDDTWEPDGGENAVVIQPGGELDVEHQALLDGPSREEFDAKIVDKEIDDEELSECRIGGTPVFMQGDEFPEPREEWVFVAQLDSCSLPFEINFGDAGIAYVFVNTAGTKGKFLWQCG